MLYCLSLTYYVFMHTNRELDEQATKRALEPQPSDTHAAGAPNKRKRIETGTDSDIVSSTLQQHMSPALGNLSSEAIGMLESTINTIASALSSHPSFATADGSGSSVAHDMIK